MAKVKEIWKDVEGYEGHYEISSLGKFKSSKYGRKTILTQQIGTTGYFHVFLSVKSKVKIIKTHRLVAKAFIPNPQNKPQVNHKDGNKLNNRLSNLEWVTHKENAEHAYKSGLTTVDHFNKKVICTKTGKTFESVVEAAKASGYNYGTLCNMLNENFKHQPNKSSLRYVD